jgi:anti-sigma-K factor RskA
MSRVKRYQDPEVYERLAGEYVLGTLRGGALRRFERLMHERPYIRYAVDTWEDRLNPMAESLPDVAPDPRVWKEISKALKQGSRSQVTDSAIPATGKGTRFWQSLGLWQAATALMSVLLAVVVLIPQQKSEPLPMPSYVAVLESDSKVPMMVTMGDMAKRVVSVRIMEMPEVGEDQDIQLWAMREHDESPLPVGILQRDTMETHLSLSKHQWQENVKGAKMFAVSFEPKGGSSSGQPSGKMMYKGACLDFI